MSGDNGQIILDGVLRDASSLTAPERKRVMEAIDSRVGEEHPAQILASSEPFKKLWQWIGRFAVEWQRVEGYIFRADNPERIQRMIVAAQGVGPHTPDTNIERWLSDAWDVICSRVDAHQRAGRVRQAAAWQAAAAFFAERYEGQF